MRVAYHSWECGLKFIIVIINIRIIYVAPFVGVWIEITGTKVSVYKIKVAPFVGGVLPVKRTIKNNKFLYRQPCYGWRYFMLLLCIAYDIPLVSLHVVFFEVVHCCNNLCN